MPYVVVSTQIRVENGPTIVGDDKSDPEIMKYLGAEMVTQLGNNFQKYEKINSVEKKKTWITGCACLKKKIIAHHCKEYRCCDPPRVVLDKLELKGFKVLAMAGIGQTCVWTLHKPPEFLPA